MEQLMKEITAYLDYLNEQCGLQVSFHFGKEKLNHMPESVLTALQPYNAHQNPYCIMVKRNGEKHRRCLRAQQMVLQKCKKCGSFCGVCHAGVSEFIYPIYEDGAVAGYAAALAEDLGCTIQLLKDDELKSLGCGGILAVNQGSSRPAVLAALRYEGAPASPLTALVGKGVMFDSGGYHLKDIDGMKGMKLDMCGAADVLETFEILARRKVKKNLLAILVLVENVISPDACKMGDVITMMGGQTVEIYNTDAEGRLILADGLEYAQRQGARQVIDVATLTYGCQAALGDEVTGVFCNSDTLFSAWQQAAGTAREKIWRLPLMEVYHRNLEWSVCADFANYAPGKGAAASTAACFLEKFIHPETEWLHLDMVGTATNRGEQKGMAMGASGAMIGSLIRFLED